jgi:hypothetical protein
MIPAVDAVGPSSTFDDIKCIWLNFPCISVCHLTMFLDSGSVLILSHF